VLIILSVCLYSACLNYPAGKSHFSAPHYIAIFGLPGSIILFFYIISQTA